MEPHNALQQVRLELDTLSIEGFSISGLATYVQVPELDVCFDMGECPLSALHLNHVFLTHAHGDHSRCMIRHWYLRRMVGMVKPPTYFLPETIRPAYEELVRAEARFEGLPDAEIDLPHLVGMTNGGYADLPARPDLRAFAFSVHHSVPSLGYTLLARKKKLKPEYASMPGYEIAELRRSGVEVQYDVEDPLVTFLGDHTGASLLEQAHIWSSPIVIVESTFVDPGEEHLAAQKTHTHLTEVAAALEQIGDRITSKHIVLKHFSMKYSQDHVRAAVARGIPERFRERIRILL